MVGASTIPGTYILPRLVGTFKSSYPSIQITLKIGSSGEVVQKILDGKVEFGVIGARWDEKRISLEEIYSDELVLAVYPGHPWQGRENVELNELAGVHFVMRERSSGTRMVMAQALDGGRIFPIASGCGRGNGQHGGRKGGGKSQDRSVHNLFIRSEGGYRKKQSICGFSKRDFYSQAVFSGAEKASRALTTVFGLFGAPEE